MNYVCKLCRTNFQKKYKEQMFCSLRCSNGFNLNNKNSVSLPPKYNEGLAELFGILLGDGSVTKYYIKIYLNRVADSDYVSFVKNLLQKLFSGVPVTIQLPLNKGTTEIQLSSKDVCDYLIKAGFNAKKRCIPSWIMKRVKFIKAVVRGLFDTEGSVGIKYFRGRNDNYLYKQLTVTNSNKNILRFLEDSLTMLGYKPTKNSNKNIYLSNKSDIKKYLSVIGSNNPKMIRKINIAEIDGFKYGGLRRMARHQS